MNKQDILQLVNQQYIHNKKLEIELERLKITSENTESQNMSIQATVDYLAMMAE